MKVIEALGWYFPDAAGGSEVYVQGLGRELQARGFSVTVAAPRTGVQEDHYQHEGLDVYRYPVHPGRSQAQVRGEEPHAGFDRFERWLRAQDAQIYHQHTLGLGCGLHHLRLARELGLVTILTAHLAESVCLRGTMLLDGRRPCDGRILMGRCSRCWGTARGIPGGIAQVLGLIPPSWSQAAASLGGPSRIASALATASLVEKHQARLIELSGIVDRVVVVCQWLYDALARNGVPKEKLVLCRQGTEQAQGAAAAPPAIPTGPLRIGVLSRWDEVKGIHVLVQALRRVPMNIPIELTFHMVEPRGAGHAYRKRVMGLAGGDPRITFDRMLAPGEIRAALAGFDMLAVPSLWLETGPLVVLEAFAAGIPVLGSDRGGISELVRHGANGWLVPAGDVMAWTQALSFLGEERGQVETLRRGIGPVRTVTSVASEMAMLYNKLYEPD